MKKSLIAGASVMALAGAVMPMAGVFATDDTSSTDTISVQVDASCTFSAGGADGEYSVAHATNQSGVVAPVNTSSSSDHVFTVFCNNNAGYKVTASTGALVQNPAINDKFVYANTLPQSGADGAWHATVAVPSGSPLTVTQLPDPATGETTTSADIITLGAASGASGESFTVTYSAYVGTETPAGTYSNTIGYTLAAN